MSSLQCFNMGHNGHGISMYGVSMTPMGNLHAGGQSSLGHLSLLHRISCTVNRLSVGSTTNDHYEQIWNVFREWDHPNMPTVSKITDFVLHLFMDLQFATMTITGHRSALSSLMTFRWLNISRIPDRNILVISFSVEFSSTNRETP